MRCYNAGMSDEPKSVKHTVACPYCGCEQFTDGEVPAYGQMQFVKTFPDGRKPAGKPVHARACDQCGNVQLYVRQ